MLSFDITLHIPCVEREVEPSVLRPTDSCVLRVAHVSRCALSDLTVADLRTIHPLFADDVVQVRAGWWRAWLLVCLSCVAHNWLVREF